MAAVPTIRAINDYIKLTRYTVYVCVFVAGITFLVQQVKNNVITIAPYVLLMSGTIVCYILAEKRIVEQSYDAYQYLGIIAPTVMTLVPIMIAIFTVSSIVHRVDIYNAAKKNIKREKDLGNTMSKIKGWGAAAFAVLTLQVLLILGAFTYTSSESTTASSEGNVWLPFVPPLSLLFAAFSIFCCSNIYYSAMDGFADG